jgi:hypothetical protein
MKRVLLERIGELEFTHDWTVLAHFAKSVPVGVIPNAERRVILKDRKARVDNLEGIALFLKIYRQSVDLGRFPGPNRR